jgi:hypothetical protein
MFFVDVVLHRMKLKFVEVAGGLFGTGARTNTWACDVRELSGCQTASLPFHLDLLCHSHSCACLLTVCGAHQLSGLAYSCLFTLNCFAR